jgi:hypothetical protein
MSNWKSAARVALLSSGFLAVAPITCNSIFAKRTPKADDGEYELVTTSGSMIPQRVKKGSKIETTSAVSEMSVESFEKMQQKSTGVNKALGGP